MRGGIPPLPQYAFMARCLFKHRDNFTLHYTVQRLGGRDETGEARHVERHYTRAVERVRELKKRDRHRTFTKFLLAVIK
jgi:hypothetical protein